MNNKKIIDIFSMNHDGTIIKIEPENSNLDIKIEIEYLASIINKKYTIMNYKLLEYKEIMFIDICENKIYNNIIEIEKMELSILDAKEGSDSIIIDVCSEKCHYGQIHLLSDDINVYDQNNTEIKYEKLKK